MYTSIWRKKSGRFLLSVMALALGSSSACRGGDTGEAGAADASTLAPDLADRDSAYLFDQTALRTFELRLSEADLAFLDADPMAEQYVPGELAFEGERVSGVGIRYKGSLGSFVGCLSRRGFPPSGSKTCVKLGMKIKIDYSDENARFFGQKKLLFHAMNSDRSLLRERFGYGVFNALGVHASRSAHVRLLINGKFVGLFLLVEEVDGRFTRARFADGGEGNLYKEVWPVGNDAARYLAALESNRTESPSAAKIVALADALAQANDSTLPGVVEHWLDLDYAARFIAVDRALRHDDGPHHWYCSGGGLDLGSWQQQRVYAGRSCGNHNYYWYEDTGAERLWPIPWDLDNAMPVVDGFTQVPTPWDDLSVDCTALVTRGNGGPQMPATCDPLHRGFALALRERVADSLSALAEGPLSEVEIAAKLEMWTAQIEPVVAEANALYPSELSPLVWHDQVQQLRTTLRRLRDEALAHRAQ